MNRFPGIFNPQTFDPKGFGQGGGMIWQISSLAKALSCAHFAVADSNKDESGLQQNLPLSEAGKNSQQFTSQYHCIRITLIRILL